MYPIKYTFDIVKELKQIPKQQQAVILKKVTLLAENPRPVQAIKLQPKSEELYRIRIGNYRVVYQILDKCLIVTIIQIDHRKQIYK
ncbi:MAG: type II toxin-antitoxin system RelE/ParE family toxin [Parachlamydiales bacterium]|nr:type II toxin-antitoxin system RelE/ParE family toxin [Parachlamydiales bacterium]